MAARPSSASERLPRPAESRLPFGALAANFVLRPWFDWVAVRAVAKWYLPLSRGWAAATQAGRDPARFLQALPGSGLDRGQVAQLLRVVERRRRSYEKAAEAWEAAFFGPQACSAGRLVEAEVGRHGKAHLFMATRAVFLPFRARLPAVKWEVARPEAVAELHGARLTRPELAFSAPAPAEIVQSRTVPGAYGPEHWLRFDSPVLGDSAWARVYDLEAARDPPTFVYLHGVCMENEMWRGGASPVAPLSRRGFRVICAEGPWHGRRRMAGRYGGEPVIARGPLGLLDLLQAWVSEVALLIGWARRTSRGPVVLGGISLGALTGQIAASAAPGWPESLRPDALFLVATSGELLDVAREGSLTRGLGLPGQLSAAGWNERELSRWLPLLEPASEPPLPPECIFLLLGSSDDLTPYPGGGELGRAWRLPEANLFVRPQGHFSVSLGLLHDSRPLDALVAALPRG